MKVISTQDCFFDNGLRLANEPFETSSMIVDYPYLKEVDAKNKLTKVESEVESEVETNDMYFSKIINAINKLDKDNDEHWTTKDEPAVAAVEDILGYSVTRQDIKAAYPGVSRP